MMDDVKTLENAFFNINVGNYSVAKRLLDQYACVNPRDWRLYIGYYFVTGRTDDNILMEAIKCAVYNGDYKSVTLDIGDLKDYVWELRCCPEGYNGSITRSKISTAEKIVLDKVQSSLASEKSKVVDPHILDSFYEELNRLTKEQKKASSSDLSSIYENMKKNDDYDDDDEYEEEDEDEDDDDDFEDDEKFVGRTIYDDKGCIIKICDVNFNDVDELITISLWCGMTVGDMAKIYLGDVSVNNCDASCDWWDSLPCQYDAELFEAEIYASDIDDDDIDYYEIKDISFKIVLKDYFSNRVIDVSDEVRIRVNVESGTFHVY